MPGKCPGPQYGTASCKVPFTVKRSAKAPAASLSVKTAGTIDVLRPTSSVTVTPTVKNLYGWSLSTGDIQITKTYDGATKKTVRQDATRLFTVKVEDGKYVITGSGELSHLDKYTMTVRIGGASSKASALTVKMGSAKIAQSAKTVTLLKDDRYSSAAVTLSPGDPALAGIDWERSLTEARLLANNAPYTLEHFGDTLEIRYRNDRITKAGTVKIPVFLIGNKSDKPNATVSVGVKLI